MVAHVLLGGVGDGLEVPRAETPLAHRTVDVGAGSLVGSHVGVERSDVPAVVDLALESGGTVGVLGVRGEVRQLGPVGGEVVQLRRVGL